MLIEYLFYGEAIRAYFLIIISVYIKERWEGKRMQYISETTNREERGFQGERISP